MIPVVYDYLASTERVIDGDSLVCTINLGFDFQQNGQHVRLRDVNTAELRPKAGDQYEDAIRHHTFTEAWLLAAHLDYDGKWPLILDSVEWSRDSFGRVLGYIYRRSDGKELNQSLIDMFGDSIRYNW